MFGEFLRFELRHQIRQPLWWSTALVFAAMTFGAVTTDAVQIGGSIGNVHRNAPFVILQFLTVMSVLAVFVVTAFVASAALRDFDRGAHELFFSKPVRSRDYLLGRFAGALIISIAVLVVCAIGILIGALMPWLEPERIGPIRLAPYAYALGVIVIPNLFFASAVFFTAAILTRSWLGTYIAVVGFFAGYLLAQVLVGDVEQQTLASLLDPFGGAALASATRYWTVSERNASTPGLAWPLMANRALWAAVGALVLGVGCWAFRPTARLEGWRRRQARKGPAGVEAETRASDARTAVAVVPRPPRSFSSAARWTQLRRATGFELASVLKSVPFLVILAFGVLNALGSATAREQLYGTSVYPVTRLMLENLQGSFLFLLVIITTFYAGDLVWRERSLKVDEVTDALPVPSWLPLVSKLAALVFVVFCFLAVGALAMIGLQLWKGHRSLELGLYARGLFVDGWPFVLFAVLAVVLQVLTNHKFVGYLLMILALISQIVLNALDFDHNLYQFASTPGTPYSDMNGFGHFVAPWLWFSAYWTALAVALAGLSALFWVRGRDSSWRSRLREATARFRGPVRALMAASFVAFVALGAWIFYNTNVLNEYVPGDVAERRQADYEKKYRQYKDLPQPRIADVDAEVDIYPAERRVVMRGRYRLENRTGQPLAQLHLDIDPRVRVRRLSLPETTRELYDAEQGYSIYRLEPPLGPGASMELSFETALEHRGFVNANSNTSVVYNGTFVNNRQLAPAIGYEEGRQLLDRNDRRKHGLEPVLRMPKLEDTAARRNTYITSDSDWVGFKATVSTSADQIALAPGYLVREWRDGNRRYFRYEMDSPILHFYSFLSARWAVRRDRWKDVAIEIYHHPDHTYNVDRMIDAVKKSLDYFTTNFGPYQHRQVRILEFPRYATFAQSFPNTIPFSEGIGFIADLRDRNRIDYVFYVTAHEVAHQWWAHQVIGGNVQGATMLSESLSQYSALMVMEHEYGRDQMRRFLKYELDRYLRGRGGELIEELPLMRVENQQYIHYNKGSVVLYALRDAIGEDALNRALANYVAAFKFQQPPFTYTPDLLALLREVTPVDRASLLADLFETITLYDNRAVEARGRRLGDGRYEVTLTVSARKLRADGAGHETPMPLDDLVDIGVLAEETRDGVKRDKVLFLEKRRLTGEKATFTVTVDSPPGEAGIDPFNKLVDRNSSDNRTKVNTVGSGL